MPEGFNCQKDFGNGTPFQKGFCQWNSIAIKVFAMEFHCEKAFRNVMSLPKKVRVMEFHYQKGFGNGIPLPKRFWQ